MDTQKKIKMETNSLMKVWDIVRGKEKDYLNNEFEMLNGNIYKIIDHGICKSCDAMTGKEFEPKQYYQLKKIHHNQ